MSNSLDTFQEVWMADFRVQRPGRRASDANLFGGEGNANRPDVAALAG